MSDEPFKKLSSTEALQQLTDVSRRNLEFMFAAMQTEQHRTGAQQSFAMPGEVLGEIALKHMRT